jgi:RNA polymerase sigma-70 factor (family 1)
MKELHLSELQHRIAAFEDQQAFKELFRRFYPGLKKFAYSICHCKEEAEEAVSDVFVRIWLKRKTIDHIHNLKLYLYIATRNYSINYLRAHKQIESIQLEDLKVDIDSMVSNPQQQLISAELEQQLLAAVNELPSQCKIIYKLVKEDGLKQKEVAELLHLQPKTVENQIAIAVRKIGQTLLKVNALQGR